LIILLDIISEFLCLNIKVIFCFIGFNLPQITCQSIWINYSTVVHLPQGHGILHSETGNSKGYILFQ